MMGNPLPIYTEKQGLSNNYVRSIQEDPSGNLWFGTNGGGITILAHSGLSYKDIFAPLDEFGEKRESIPRIFDVFNSGKPVYFNNSIVLHLTEKEGLSENNIFAMQFDKTGNLYAGTQLGLSKMASNCVEDLNLLLKKAIDPAVPLFENYSYEDGFLGIGVNGNNNGKNIYEASDGSIWIAANDRLTVYHPGGQCTDTIPPNIQLTSIELFNENIEWLNLAKNQDTNVTLGNGVKVGNFEFDDITKWYGLPQNLSLKYNNNYLTFNYIGITQKQSQKVKYQYKLEGIDQNWSGITSRTKAPYGNLPHGNYTFKVKSMNSDGYWSPIYTYSFEIRPPWWLTWWFRTTYILAALLVLLGFYRWRTNKLKKEKKILEEKVKERTAELQYANEEITSQRDEIAAQRDTVTQQKEHIEKIHHELTDSINYAKRLQTSALPDIKRVKNVLSDIFVLFKPKDVVSGDFYWYAEVDNQIVITVADCTGHGVPGAFMSMLGMSMLKEIVVKESITQPDEILHKLRREVIKALGQTGALGEQNNGMDMSLCSINKKNFEMQWSGANNPCLLVQNNEFIEIKADKMPIAIYEKMDRFALHELSLNKGDVIYLISDGFPDQFGGPKAKKFMFKKLKKLLLEISSKPMAVQYKILEKTITDWMTAYDVDYEQTDDITVMGIKI
jgi:serine phosphatase RsbU (regulator of sigma subunit)